ncbi:Uncharacterised protein [Escherichia coli]|uniref:Uncharacterized protein n=1 Tax=Escherichia coli TaxID=562 RepID=A0A376TNB0_ECOLX|nr:Uncharacterised protein [Escherichia coli]
MHWRKTTRQNEWRAFLLEQQINVDLIKTMVTFNSEEGGLTRFIEYKTEHDFLGAFSPAPCLKMRLSGCGNW